jgi:hypothetical protein
MNDKNIQLELSFEEVNLVLKALGQMPFNQVYELIGSIHEQANAQMQNGNAFNIGKKD